MWRNPFYLHYHTPGGNDPEKLFTLGLYIVATVFNGRGLMNIKIACFTLFFWSTLTVQSALAGFEPWAAPLELPPNALAFLSSIDEGYTPVTIDMFEDAVIKRWESPGSVSADFNGDGLTDFAVIASTLKGDVDLVILMGQEGDESYYRYPTSVNFAWAGLPIRGYIKISLGGLLVSTKHSSVSHWKNGKFESTLLSD